MDGRQFTLSRRPIINGSVDTVHTSVVALTMHIYGTYEQFCTGTVIATRAILTAGHCIKESGLQPTEVTVYFGQTVGIGGQMIPVTAGYVHPNYYLSGNGAPVNDVAVLILGQDAPVAPMAWQGTTLGNIIGQTVTLVGYGVTDAASQTGNGTRRVVDQAVSDMDDMYLYYQGGSSGTCQGDSGGPMFLNVGGTETVVGVTSFGDQSCVQLGANTRVDPYASFIAQYAGSSSSGEQPVTVTITSPQNGSTQGPSFTVSANVTSTAGVARAELLINNSPSGSLTQGPWTFQASNLPNGAHTIVVRGTGQDGGTGQASITVTVAAAQTTCSESNPCPQGFDCVNQQCVSNQVVPGTTGAPCTGNAECQSGICIDGDTPDGYCSQACQGPSDCPHSAACWDVGGMRLCGPPDSITGHPLAREVAGGCHAAGHPGGPLGAVLLLLALGLARGRPRG
jgi:secreted trypsin-like serine protease